jgi:4-diphosphocytidyl-2-C-methyl-D-erythritol kinase
MICFPNAKINLGLNVIEKRSDNFHNIETVFYPIGWSDALEIIEMPNSVSDFNLNLSGIAIEGKTKDNLLYKAYHLIKKIKPLPNITVYLHKALPMGAGLGGGSADAAFFINLLNQQFALNLSETERLEIARPLGSDCAFFLHNKPVFAQEKGDIFNHIELDLSNYYIAVIYPNVHSNTKDAYSLVKPAKQTKSITDIIKQPIATWKHKLVNDFENSIFSKYPVVEKTKHTLYDLGAIYASMSGSGSAVFGLFDKLPILNELDHFPHWIGRMK